MATKHFFLGSLLAAFAITLLGLEMIAYLLESRYPFPFFSRSKPDQLETTKIVKRQQEIGFIDPTIGIRLKPQIPIKGFNADKDGFFQFDSDPILHTDQYGFVRNQTSELIAGRINEMINDDSIFRVLISGNSAMMGFGVRDRKKNLVAHLIRSFNEQLVQKGKYRHIVLFNTAVPAQSLPIGVRRFIEETQYLNPHLVIHGAFDYVWPLSMENAIDNTATKFDYLIKTKLNPQYFSQGWLIFPNLFDFILQHIIKKPLPKQYPPPFYYRNEKYLPISQTETFLRSIRTFEQVAKLVGSHFIFFQGPVLGSCNKPLSNWEQKLKENFFRSPIYQHKGKKAEQIFAEIKSKQQARQEILRQIPGTLDLSCLFQNTQDTVYADPLHLNEWGQKLLFEKLAKSIGRITL